MADFAIDDVDTINLLAAVIDNRVFPETSSGTRYLMHSEDHQESAEVDNGLIVWLVWEHYLTTDTAHHLVATDLGRSSLDNELFMLEILGAVRDGRVYCTNRSDTLNRLLFAYDPVDDDQFDGTGFALAPLVDELEQVELDPHLVPRLTDAGRQRLDLFGLLDTEE